MSTKGVVVERLKKGGGQEGGWLKGVEGWRKGGEEGKDGEFCVTHI